ncbi:MAG TPA: pantoate--beta-alanine ligase [Bacteroidia bacterium]|jgi:pantoate--beta-alanine ligase|nr:pantoate--beta-alanine ligase [Bacteroidia bacterium]
MRTLQTIPELQNQLADLRKKGRQIGFVPTMGALHPGHISLIERAKAENGIVVCSIFVNPTQFNDPKDLERYPRTPEKDAGMLQEAGCDLLFTPEIKEMYPSGMVQKNPLNLGMLDKVMEGRHRPGHFEGVIQIVGRLFEIVGPDRAYFGQKDFQQVAVIREMVRQTGSPVEIIACPILREPNGLAMSSRNMLLSAEERERAAGIYVLLKRLKEMAPSSPSSALQEYAALFISSVPGMTLEYLEVADSQTLLPVKAISDAPGVVACIAVKLGKVRLIDNIILK